MPQSSLTCQVIDTPFLDRPIVEPISPSIPEGYFIPEEVATGMTREVILEPGEPLVLTERGRMYQKIFVKRTALHELMDTSTNPNLEDPADTGRALGRKRFAKQWEHYDAMHELSESLGFPYDARVVEQKQQEFMLTVNQACEEITRNYRYEGDIDRISRTGTIFVGSKNNGNA